MPENVALVGRIRKVVGTQPGVAEKRMFGGVSFLINGNLCCGVLGDEMIVRVGPEAYDTAMARPHVRVFDYSGRPMKGWVTVTAGGYAEDADLRDWVQRGVDFVTTLPPK